MARRLDIEVAAVAEVRVFDEQAIVCERQHVHEAKAVALRQSCIHQHRPIEAVRLGKHELATEKLFANRMLVAVLVSPRASMTTRA